MGKCVRFSEDVEVCIVGIVRNSVVVDSGEVSI